MDEKIKELIAIGASVSAHCQPCLKYHVKRAQELGNDEEEIREAVALGHMVGKGSATAMREFTGNLWADSAADTPDCCAAAVDCRTNTEDT